MATFEDFTHKTLVTNPAGQTYSYYLSPGFHEKISPSVPTLMLLHGYPDEAFMWAGAIPRLSKLPYPIIIPDLLGFGGSSKPLDAAKYNYKQQADSLNEILDTEGVPQSQSVIPIGHDWGSATSQRFYLYHRERCVGLTLISLAYQVPTDQPFDLATANATTSKRFGYPQWEYWNFFTGPSAPATMEANLLRFYEVNHGVFPSPNPDENGRDVWMREMFCTPGAMGEYVTRTGRYAGYTVALKPYAESAEMKRRFVERFERDGFGGPVNYYHSLKDNTMLEEERRLCEKGPDGEDRRRIDVPLLYLGQTGDWVCRTDLMVDAKEAGLVDDCEEHVVDAGHWVLYEAPDEIARLIEQWLMRRFPVNQ